DLVAVALRDDLAPESRVRARATQAEQARGVGLLECHGGLLYRVDHVDRGEDGRVAVTERDPGPTRRAIGTPTTPQARQSATPVAPAPAVCRARLTSTRSRPGCVQATLPETWAGVSFRRRRIARASCGAAPAGIVSP